MNKKRQVFLHDTVLDAARERISMCFDDFPNICVSVSGGKDSTVLAHLVLSEGARRGRRVLIFFLDEEVDYEATIDQIKYLMYDLFPDVAVPVWYQFPFHLTNATSLTEGQLIAWEPGKRDLWMRKREPGSIHRAPWDPETITVRNKVKGLGFYDVLDNFERHRKDTCFFVGLRAQEAPNRRWAVIKNPGHKDWNWTTKKANNCISAYPLYDWYFGDIWHYIFENNLKYNRMYDYMWKKGMPVNEIRVSSLIHEKSFHSITELPEFEPKTYDKLCKRISGIQTAQIYGKEKLMHKCRQLPSVYKTWQEYRDFLLMTYQDEEKKQIFEKRFAKHLQNEYVARQQCRQLILNDYENNLPVKNHEDPREIRKQQTLEKWRNLLL